MMEEFEQMSLTEASFEPYRIKNKIRLIELFGGIGAQAKALEILGADFEHYRLVEWAVNSIIGYNAIHIKDFADHSDGMSKDELIAKQLEDNERFRSNGNRFGLKQGLAHLRKLQCERRRGNGRK